MTKITPIQIDASTIIYVEVADSTQESVSIPSREDFQEEAPITYGPDWGKLPQQVVQKGIEAMQTTIRAYTDLALDAFDGVSKANVNKVTLEFGVQISGETSLIPYITKSATESNLKITVECSFPNKDIVSGGK